MKTIKEILISRDGMSAEDADDLLEGMRQAVLDGSDPEEELYAIGLEPDYVFDLFP